jgi:Major Facilitator Superfamily
VTSSQARRAAFGEMFARGEFRALWLSQVLSEVGDRLALVALTLLVYDRTGSALLSAIAYAGGYLPWVIGGLALSGLGDRLPRRELMVVCDLVRAVLVTVMLVPGMPVAGLVAVVYAVTAVQAPFEAARSAILPDIVPAERYVVAAAVMQTTFRVAIVAGAVAGGLTAALVGARPALAADAATFVASAILVRCGTRARPAAARPGPGPGAVRQLGEGAQQVLGDKAVRTLMMLGWLIALYAIPEGIAAPYAGRLGGGPAAAGLIIASGQAGAVLLTPAFTTRVGPLTRQRWIGPMACCACAVLMLTVFGPGLYASIAIFALSGTFGIYQVAANTAFVAKVPDDRRAQAFGLASTGTVLAQGGALLVAGAAAQVFPPATVVAAGGCLGAVTACGLGLRWRHIAPVVGRHSARHLHGEAPPPARTAETPAASCRPADPAYGSLATVSTTAESCSAWRLCGASGTMSRSPLLPSQDCSPAASRTRPCSTYTLASPGLTCSVSSASRTMAMTVWRSTFSCPPMTVCAARPPVASAARPRSSRATASRESFCMRSSYPAPAGETAASFRSQSVN